MIAMLFGSAVYLTSSVKGVLSDSYPLDQDAPLPKEVNYERGWAENQTETPFASGRNPIDMSTPLSRTKLLAQSIKKLILLPLTLTNGDVLCE
jgi:hypothetical protein